MIRPAGKDWIPVWAALGLALGVQLAPAETAARWGLTPELGLAALLAAMAWVLVTDVRFPLVLVVATLATVSGAVGAAATALGLDRSTGLVLLALTVATALFRYTLQLGPSNDGSPLRSERGAKALMHAVDKGDIGYTVRMLDMGVDVNARDEHGETPLMRAAHKGYADMVELLIDSGAEPGVENHEGETAMTIALMSGYGRIAELLRREARNAAASAPRAAGSARGG